MSPRKEFMSQASSPPALVDDITLPAQNTQQYSYSPHVLENAYYWREHEIISRMQGNALRAEIESSKWREWLHVEIWPLAAFYLMPAAQYDYSAHMESLSPKDARRKAYKLQEKRSAFLAENS